MCITKRNAKPKRHWSVKLHHFQQTLSFLVAHNARLSQHHLHGVLNFIVQRVCKLICAGSQGFPENSYFPWFSKYHTRSSSYKTDRTWKHCASRHNTLLYFKSTSGFLFNGESSIIAFMLTILRRRHFTCIISIYAAYISPCTITTCLYYAATSF